ncbi:MAG TPA: ribonuclease H-like domain-containing protein [Oligoflexia bacterium]|nr:ribonuclease H-like domain-containing protein [Oligoflexia bacterium]HMP26845.1 ribonuclease H-like domain-containing protein [Oligoflexia bacterium]
MLENINLENLLFLDIECVPSFPSYDALTDELKILWSEKSASFRKEQETSSNSYERAGIYAEFGKIICVALGKFYFEEQRLGIKLKSLQSDDENKLLSELSELLNKQPADTVLVAHNGKEFDFPYICRRMIINNQPLPKILNSAGKKPWEIQHLDTMELWKFGDRKSFTSLNLLATIFGLPNPKDDISGKDVGRVYWQDKDLIRISTYCKKDVLITARVFLRLMGIEDLSEAHIKYL